jgi:hypothetical protein
MKFLKGLALGVPVCSAARAQDTNPCSGTWQAHLVNNQGEHRRGTVVPGETDGRWEFEHRVYKNPCVGMPAPILIRGATADEPVFEVLGSGSLRGCRDNVVTLQRTDEHTLAGELDDGRRLPLTRE